MRSILYFAEIIISCIPASIIIWGIFYLSLDDDVDVEEPDQKDVFDRIPGDW